MSRHEFIPSPYRKLVTLTIEDFVRDDDEGVDLTTEAPVIESAIVRLELPPDSHITVAEARRAIEQAGAFEARVTQARAESERRVRESGVTHGQALDEQLREWLKLKPDLHPLTEQIIAEAMRFEQAVREGAA